jgi:formate dehydrogenase subunit gamma
VNDLKWFLKIVGYFKGHEYPSGKFNAGEKLVFWLVLVIFSTILIVSGLILVFPNFDQTRQTMQIANIVHMAVAYVAIALACVHIYLGTIGMTSAYRAMRYGYVDASWAKHHHLRWYEQVVAGKAREKFVQPGSVPPAMGQQKPALRQT